MGVIALSSILTDQLLKLLSRWGERVRAELGAQGVYCFGSLVYLGGEQFTQDSDVDLVVHMPVLPDGIERSDWLVRFLPLKIELEESLARALCRAEGAGKICSVVALTDDELVADLHKGGAADFFASNQFFDLESGKVLNGLPGAGGAPVAERLVAECLKFAQGLRNAFLGVDRMGGSGIADFADATDPAPKAIMRHAAMVRYLEDTGDRDPGAQFDVAIGADRITIALDKRRADLGGLDRRYASRRGGRAQRATLSADDQLILAELIFDAAIQLQAKKTRKEPEDKLPSLRGMHSTILFAKRFANAFPGVRGIQWFDGADELAMRLEALLAEPLKFEDGTPIWWSRGGSNFHISTFSADRPNFLLNDDEMRISRVAAVNPGSYKYNFVYVAVDPLEPVGIYHTTAQRIAEVESGDSAFPYHWEEYGVVDGTHLISRAELDDGSAIIDGKLQTISDRSELRGRYVTAYNFVIAAAGAPILNSDYDRCLEDHLNAMLKGEERLPTMFKEVLRLPAGRY